MIVSAMLKFRCMYNVQSTIVRDELVDSDCSITILITHWFKCEIAPFEVYSGRYKKCVSILIEKPLTFPKLLEFPRIYQQSEKTFLRVVFLFGSDQAAALFLSENR